MAIFQEGNTHGPAVRPLPLLAPAPEMCSFLGLRNTSRTLVLVEQPFPATMQATGLRLAAPLTFPGRKWTLRR